MNLDYQIALTNVPFDNSYKNVLRFDTRSEQEAYFQTNTLFSNSPDVNFNVGSLYATNVVYDGNENENINELLNKNYCIVKDKRENATIKYYYYYVTNAKQDCDNRILLALELDVFQTYYIDILFSDSVIYKAHLNRFIDNGDGTVSFDGTPTSKLFEREDIQNVAKRLTDRQKLNIYNFNDTTLNNWLNENISGWLYLFVDSTHTFKLANVETGTTGIANAVDAKIEPCRYLQYGSLNIENLTGREGVPNNMSIVCVPVYKKDTNHIRIKFPFNNTTPSTFGGDEISPFSLDAFMEDNAGANFVYSFKFSLIPPFYFGYVPPYNFNNLGDLVLDYSTAETTTQSKYGNDYVGTFALRTSTGGYPLINIYKQDYQIKIHNTMQIVKKFNKQDIINSNKNVEFNPKLNASDYKDLRLVNNVGDFFNYDIQKLNTNDFDILITETLTPDIAKQYVRILPPANNVYNEQTAQNLLGLISQNDNSLTLISTAFQSMLANNKNYFLQNAINRNLDVAMAPARAVEQVGKGNILGGVGTAIQAGIDYARSQINEQLTVDNLQNAPSAIQGAKGNAIFNTCYTDVGIYVELHDILDNEKEMINDYMCLFGFTYNRVDNIKNVDNIRKIYNFVRADIETINSSNVSISETVRKKFRECFANGVRFWNTDTFAYNKENYERWLENE